VWAPKQELRDFDLHKGVSDNLSLVVPHVSKERSQAESLVAAQLRGRH